METLALVLIVFLVIIFVALIFGTTGYYGNPIGSPLPLRESQIDPEKELDLYIISTTSLGQTSENLVYSYKNTTVVFQYNSSEFNYSDPAPISIQYIQSNRVLDIASFMNEGFARSYLIPITLGSVTVGVLFQLAGFRENLYAMIKAFESSLPVDSEWVLIFTPNQNLERYSNEFRVYPTVLDPVSNLAYNYGIISSLNFNKRISVETIVKIDKGLRIRMRANNNIQEKYPETTTSDDIVDQDEMYPVSLVGFDASTPFGSLRSGQIIETLFP
jgi:hypothetical protein